MAAQKGRSMVLKVEATPGGGTYTTVAGLTSNGLTINNEPVDTTNKSSSGIRKLLAGGGTNSISLTASGVFNDDSGYQLIRASARANTHLSYQLFIPGDTNDETYEGDFMIASLEETGEHNGSVTFTITLESDGAVTVS